MNQSDLAATLAHLARSLGDKDGLDETLRGVVYSAVGTIPGAGYAGITVTEGRRVLRTPAATDELVVKVDEAQYETAQGPCVDALYEARVVRVPDLSTETRWPVFATRAVDLGVGSALSFQLYVAGDSLGALNLYSRDAAAFDDGSEYVGSLFAAHAAVAMAGARKEDQLTEAIATRDLIGQAKGILIERYKITGEQAFALLIRVSQRTNTKLRDVAEYLVRSGHLADIRSRR
jgi:hypothetical protein